MATRPSPRSSDSTRPRSKSGSGRPPSSPRSSDPSHQTTGRAHGATDKPMPSFLRPTVSSSLHSSSSSPSLSASSSSKGPAATARRSADKAPAQTLGGQLPITPKDKDKAKAPASSASRWSAVSPRQLMQKASNAIKATSKSRGKKTKDGAPSPASLASGKERAGPSTEATSETARGQLVEAQHQQPEQPAELPPSVQAEEAALEHKAERNEQHMAAPQVAVSTHTKTVDEKNQEEQVSSEQPKVEVEEKVVVMEKTILEDAGAVNVETPEPELQEEQPQSCAFAETQTEAQKNSEEGSPAVVVEESANEAAPPERNSEPATGEVEQTVVVEETKAEPEARQQEEALIPEEIVENSETSVISEGPKEESSVISEEPKENPAPVEKQEEVAEESEVAMGSSVSPPITPLKEALEDAETALPEQVTASEPVTPMKEANTISKDNAAIETLLSASAAPTLASTIENGGASSKQTTATTEASKLPFKGSKVKTAMEKRSDEEQPKKKEVARSNDVIEEAKSKLLEKRKSKVKALVGAFETVMDSPGKSS